MICVGIDVAKDKHDCFILSSEGEVLTDVFTIQNNAEGFDTLLQTIRCCARPVSYTHLDVYKRQALFHLQRLSSLSALFLHVPRPRSFM